MKKRVVSVLGVVLSLSIGGGVYWWKHLMPVEPDPKPRFTIRKETTFITTPVDSEGYIDYPTALNERLLEGITPERNANVLLLQAIGPHPEGASIPPEYFQWMGMEAPPEMGDYYVDLKKHLGERGDKNHPPITGPDLMAKVHQKPWTSDQYPLISNWLKRNEKPLALVLKATKRPEYFNPLVPKKTSIGSHGLISARLYTVQTCRDISNALVARTLMRLGEGQVEEAWQDLLACHRLARLLSRGASPIDLLVGHAISHVSFSADYVFLSHPGVSDEQVRRCRRDLSQLPAMSLPVDKMDFGERFLFLDIVLNLNRYGINTMEDLEKEVERDGSGSKVDRWMNAIDFDYALRMGNEWFDRIVEVLHEKDHKRRKLGMAALTQEIKANVDRVKAQKSFLEQLLAGGNSVEALSIRIGEILTAMMLPAFEKIQAAADQYEQSERHQHIAFALAACKRENGRYPQTLEELSPNYLERVPNDLYSGKALQYRPVDDGYLLYSVGLNELDEEGRSRGDTPRGDDIRVRIPVVVPMDAPAQK